MHVHTAVGGIVLLLTSLTFLKSSAGEADYLNYDIPKDAVRRSILAKPSSRITFGYYTPTGELVAKETVLAKSGKVVGRELYKDMKKHGIQRTWHENGQPESSEAYCNGVREGWCEYWDADGRLVGKNRFKHGTGDLFIYHANGRLAEESHFAREVEVGSRCSFYPDGQLSSYVCYRDGHHVGEGWSFYEDGKVRGWGRYDDSGEFNGPIFRVNEQGTKFVEDKDFYIHGALVKEADYLKARENDPTLPDFRDDPAWVQTTVTPEVKKLMEDYKRRPPVKIPLELEADGVTPKLREEPKPPAPPTDQKPE